MKFDDYKKSLSELNEQLKVANDELASASEETMQASIDKVSEINGKIAELKDTFIQEQNTAFIDMESKYNKAEQERLQALKIASDNANKQPPKEKDPRKIVMQGLGGI